MLKSTTTMSLRQIGDVFNAPKNHASVLASIREAMKHIETDPHYRAEITYFARKYNYLYHMIKALEIDPYWAIEKGMIQKEELEKVIKAKKKAVIIQDKFVKNNG